MKRETKFSQDAEEVIRKLEKKEDMYAMVAPSFVVDFDFHTFAERLRAIGFDKVTELTFGAKEVNHFYREFLSNHPKGLYISTPCPAVVSLVVERYPHLIPNLIPCVSPMIAMARILKKQYPGHKIIFIGPCYAKKLDAKKYNEYVDVALTYKEIDIILNHFKKPKLEKKTHFFDRFYNDTTKIYPVSGGLAQSMHVNKVIKKDQYMIVDGCPKIEKVLGNLDKKPGKIRFVDILFCKGGCIGGPCVISKDSLAKRRQKVMKYLKFARKHRTGERIGIDKYTEGISFRAKPFK